MLRLFLALLALCALTTSIYAQEDTQKQQITLKLDWALVTPLAGTTALPNEKVTPITGGTLTDMAGVGDQLIVTVFGQPDLSADVVIAANGLITLPLVGTVQVSGKNANEIAQIFSEKLVQGQYLLNPKVSVKIGQQISRSFSVLGEVVRPGRFTMQGKVSVLDALSLAGGTTARFDKSIRLLRSRESSERSDMVEYTNMRLDLDDEKINDKLLLVVQPNDVLIVGQQKNFFVHGEVRRPGMYPVEEGLNVMRVISIGGGVSERGSPSRITIHRQMPGGEIKELPAKLSDKVMPGDVVFVNERFF